MNYESRFVGLRCLIARIPLKPSTLQSVQVPVPGVRFNHELAMLKPKPYIR